MFAWIIDRKTIKGNGKFSSKYNINKLFYIEVFENPEHAILREKQIKSWSRIKKIELIESVNPDWIDRFEYLNM